jgi:hypothetical protein
MVRSQASDRKVAGRTAEAGEEMTSKGNKAHGRTERVSADRQRSTAARWPNGPEKSLEVVKTAGGQRPR